MKLTEMEKRLIERNLREIAEHQSAIEKNEKMIKILRKQIQQIEEGAKWNTQEKK